MRHAAHSGSPFSINIEGARFGISTWTYEDLEDEHPKCMVIDTNGSLYVAFTYPGSIIRKFHSNGTLDSTFGIGGVVSFGGTTGGLKLSQDNTYLYGVDRGSGKILRINANTGGDLTEVITGLNCPYGLEIDSDGNFYVTEQSFEGTISHKLKKFSSSGVLLDTFGTNSSGSSSSQFNGPVGIWDCCEIQLIR